MIHVLAFVSTSAFIRPEVKQLLIEQDFLCTQEGVRKRSFLFLQKKTEKCVTHKKGV